MAHLIVRAPGRVAFTVDVGDQLEVGRDDGNDLVLGDRQASRRHARLSRDGTGYRLVDLGSTHGTFVNGARVEERLLIDNDQIQVGNVLLVFRAGAPGRVQTFVPPTEAATPEAHDAAARRLRVLYEVSRVIGAGPDVAEIVGRMLDATLQVLGCERALVGLADGRSLGGRRISRTRGGADDPVLGREHVEALVVRRERLLVFEPEAGRAAMGVPLYTRERALGFLYVDVRGRAGAFAAEELDFLTALAHLLAALIARGEDLQRLDNLAALRAAEPRDEMLGDSEAMRALRARLMSFAAADVPVLIRGESGTGKELVASTLHALSARAGEAFVAVNCAAIPENLVESELFGHERGAFSGAVKRRRGHFALADRGTIFLDEIGDLSLAAQAKILRVLEEGEVQPVGAESAERVDVRVLSATHKPLEDEIAAGRFREDLYYRLNVGEVLVPPLRARGDDVLVLARAFIERAARRLGRGCPALGPRAVAALTGYDWPGNVRQLSNEMERAVILVAGDVIEDVALRVGPRPG
jgi:Nif-specific regulatory protein